VQNRDDGPDAAAWRAIVDHWSTHRRRCGGVHPRAAGIIAPKPRQLNALTSHINILPTVLGLAGADAETRRTISAGLAQNRPVPPLPGVDLSKVIANALGGSDVEIPIVEPDGQVLSRQEHPCGRVNRRTRTKAWKPGTSEPTQGLAVLKSVAPPIDECTGNIHLRKPTCCEGCVMSTAKPLVIHSVID
jgi:hypothetical protein